MKTILLALITLSIGFQIIAQSQELYVPFEISNAYANKTRDTSGKPGPKYWQNQTDYKISASFDPSTGLLKGNETILFCNNSPDTLKSIFFHLYQDLFKSGVARDWDLGQTDIVEGTKILELKIGGESINPNGSKVFHNSTIMGVNEIKPILPKTKVEIYIKWEVQIPMKRTVRMGRYNETSFMIAYWYPKVAVYDDTHGWSKVPHTGNCEYYSDYGNFEVEIDLPEKYTAWSSGENTNAPEIYSDTIMNRIKLAKRSFDVIKIITAADRKTGEIFRKKGGNTWKFEAENLPDFAFAISDTYLWDGVSAKNIGKNVFVSAVYPETSTDFDQVADISRKSIEYFSSQIPGIPFPYERMTAFNGHGGMEFPGMINDGDGRDLTSTIFVTSHEVGHSYFPFAVGTNEQKYAWVDEGLITYFPRRVIEKYTDDTSYVVYKDIISTYNKLAGTEVEIPLMVNSINTRQSYRYAAYTRSSAAFYTLNQYLGDEVFYKCLGEYYNRWQGKHPTPYDLFNTFNQVSGQNLTWFWEPWFFELGYADFGLKIVNLENGKSVVEVENIGGFPSHVSVKVEFADGTNATFRINANAWKSSKTYNLDAGNKKIVRATLDNELAPDVNSENNKQSQ